MVWMEQEEKREGNFGGLPLLPLLPPPSVFDIGLGSRASIVVGVGGGVGISLPLPLPPFPSYTRGERKEDLRSCAMGNAGASQGGGAAAAVLVAAAAAAAAAAALRRTRVSHGARTQVFFPFAPSV